MALRDKYDLQNLINEAEELVFLELETQLSEDWAKDICSCEDCVLDMAALALNSLKPRYRVSLLGSVYASALHEDTQERKNAHMIVNKAIKKISVNPSHGK